MSNGERGKGVCVYATNTRIVASKQSSTTTTIIIITRLTESPGENCRVWLGQQQSDHADIAGHLLPQRIHRLESLWFALLVAR